VVCREFADETRDCASDLTAVPGRFGGRVGSVGLLLAAVAVGVATAIRVLYNAPFEPVAFPPRLVPAVGTVAALASGVALAAVGLSTERPVVRVGLLFAGVFGVLATVSGAATVAAAVAIPVGAALAFARAMGPPETYFELRRGVIALTFALAVGSRSPRRPDSLGPPSERPDPPRSSRGDPPRGSGRGRPGRPRCRRTRVRGVVAASAAAPYVTGSALLAGFAVVGSPHLLVATAAFGGVAAAVSGFRGGDARLAIGAVLLLLAGVPATPGAATAVCLGAALAVLDADEFFGKADGPDEPNATEVNTR